MVLCCFSATKSRAVVSVMFSKFISDVMVLCARVPGACSTHCVFVTGAVATIAAEADGVLRYSLSYLVVGYIYL